MSVYPTSLKRFDGPKASFLIHFVVKIPSAFGGDAAIGPKANTPLWALAVADGNTLALLFLAVFKQRGYGMSWELGPR